MKPSIGRIVHYITPDKQHHAALILYVSDDGRCNLSIWNEFGGNYFHEEAAYDPEGKAPASWHFPEKVEEAPATVESGARGLTGAGDLVPAADQTQRP